MISPAILQFLLNSQQSQAPMIPTQPQPELSQNIVPPRNLYGGMLGANPPAGFQLMENGSLRGALGGIGREGGGLIGQGFGALFGNEGGVVDFGGGNIFNPGTGFQQQAQGAYQPNMPPPMASGLNFGALFNNMFGM